jgi:hypothetical protein
MEHDRLSALLREIPESRYRERGVWGDDWTLCDLISHLAEWQHMFLRWYNEGLKSGKPEMPAAGYKWNEIPRLNRAIWAKHRLRSYREARADFESGYRKILNLVKKLSPQSLLSPGYFVWTGSYPLTTYLGPNTASHYRFAIKVVKRWQRHAGMPVAPLKERSKKRKT